MIRREHISNESSLKTIGFLFMLGGFLVGVSILAGAVGDNVGPTMIGGTLLFAISDFYLWTGWSLRKLKRFSRVPAIVLATIGLLGFPLGTIISAYFLYLLCNKKAGRIFSPDYQDIITQTPHVKMKTSKFLWVLLTILLLLILGGVFLAVTSG